MKMAVMMSAGNVRRVGLACFVLLLALPSRLNAEEAPVPREPQAWLAALRRAGQAADAKGLAALASQPAVDPWLGVDALHGDGAFAAAVTFARAIRRPDQKALAAYADHTQDAAKPARSLVAQALIRAQGGDLAGARKLLSGLRDEAPAIVRFEASLAAGKYALLEGAWEAAAAAYRGAEQLASGIGWYQGQLNAMGKQVQAYMLGKAHTRRAAVLNRRLTFAERIGAPGVALETRVWQASLALLLGRPRDGIARLRTLLPALLKFGDDEYTAEAHASLAQLLAAVGAFALSLHHSDAAERLYAALDHKEGQLYARAAAIATYSGLELDRYAAQLCERQVALVSNDPYFAAERAQALLAWAISESRLGQHAMAAKHYEEALALFLAQRDTEFVAVLRLNRGSELHEARQEHAAARGDYEAVLALEQVTPRVRAYAHVFLARQGGKGAAAHAATGLVTARAVGDVLLEIRAQGALSGIRLAAGDESGAHAAAWSAVHLALADSALLGRSQSVGLLGSRGPREAAAALLAAALALGDDAKIFAAAECSRAVALVAGMGGRGQLAAMATPAALETKVQEAQRLAGATRTALERELRLGKRRKARPLLARLAEEEETERRLTARLEGERARLAELQQPVRAGLESARAWLRPGEALAQVFLAGDSLHALVVCPGSSKRVALGSMATWKPRLAALNVLRSADDAVAVDAAGRPAPVADIARSLAKTLALPSSIRTLIVMPAPEIANLPWPLLGDPKTGLRVTLAPSAGVLLRLDHAPLDPRHARLALGLSTYSYSDGSIARRVYVGSSPLRDLSTAADEAREVAGTDGRAVVESELREDAVKALLRAPAARRSVVHIACHGIMNARRPALSALALLPGPGEDGFLTVTELASMHIDTDLAVLSACDMGSMAPEPGEGAVGLPSALLGAGASRVLANLWRVSDEAAPAFMRFFYARLAAGDDVHAALRHAQAKMRKTPAWAHPYYWAGWVVWGSPR